MFLAYIRYSSRETPTLFNSISLVGKLKGSVTDFQLNCKPVSSFPVLQHTHPVSEDKSYKGVFRLGAAMSSPISQQFEATTSQVTAHCPSCPTWCKNTGSHGTQIHQAEQTTSAQNSSCAAISSGTVEAPDGSTPQPFALVQEMGQQ